MQKTLYTKTPSAALIKQAQTIADGFVKTRPPFPKGMKGRGIVICGGGYTYFTNAWVLVRMLRHHACRLPIQLWHLGSQEMTDRMKQIVAKFGVECVDGLPLIRQNPYIKNGLVKAGWVLKSVAIARCPFEEVLFLDADNLPIRDPSFLFEMPQYKSTGAIFWPDSSVFAHPSVWEIFRVPPRDEPEFESGQAVIDKRINWEAVALAERINLRADVFYRLIWGDKDTFRFAWHKLGRTFAMPEFPPQALQAAGSDADMLCQHDFDGSRLFQHRIMYKWNLFGENPWIPGFFFENECRTFLEELRLLWNGRCSNGPLRARPAEASAIKRGLFKTVWLLEIPQPAQTKPPQRGSAAGCRNGADRNATWLELGFDQNGTLRKGAGRRAVIFWDVNHHATGSQLTLSDERGPVIKLKPAKVGWQGRWIAGAHKGNTRMLTLEDVYPHLNSKVATQTIDAKAAQAIRRSFPNVVHVGHSAAGIGDHIVGVYACTGLARTGVRVVFHSLHAGWLERVQEPGLTISGEMPRRRYHELEYAYSSQLRYGVSRAQWYAAGLHPLLKPATPRINRAQKVDRLPFDRYVLLAPYTWGSVREWPDVHWTRLAHLLREAGYEVVALGNKRDEARLQNTFSSTQAYWVVNHAPAWVIDAMLGAAAFVGIDSGMTHLAALLQIKAVAIHSQLGPDFLWPEGTIKSVAPAARCVFCRWRDDRGWLNSCEHSCSALASVLPETVLNAVLELTKEGQMSARGLSCPEQQGKPKNSMQVLNRSY